MPARRDVRTARASALHVVLYVSALGPALAHTIVALLVARFPLDEAAHARVPRELDADQGRLVPAE